MITADRSSEREAVAEPREIDCPAAAAPMNELPILQRLQSAEGPMYCCPGETQPISRAVHLSRLAHYYPACLHCEHAADSGALRSDEARSPVAPTDDPQTHPSRASIFGCDGIRGVYLNEIGRGEAERLAVSIAAVLASAAPRRGRNEDGPVVTAGVHPTVVVSRDSSAASPDITLGVIRGLQRSGCEVVDVGPATRTAVDFAVYHLRAAAGIHVGSGDQRASMTGLDIIGSDGVPWSTPGMLDAARQHHNGTPGRWSRRGGEVRTFSVDASQRAEFQRHLHGVRRCRVGVMAESPIQRRQAPLWFSDASDVVVDVPPTGLPWDAEELPREVRREMRSTMQEQQLAMIVRIARDARRVQLLDELGHPVDSSVWLVRIAERLSAASTAARIVVASDLPPLARGRLKALGGDVLEVEPSHQSLVETMVRTEALLAGDGRGRVWFADHYPLCDGLVTLTHLLQLAAESGQRVSHWAV